LWCAALATWLMMFFAIIRGGAMKIIAAIREKSRRQRS
jgi:hypothetical protein